MLSILRRWMEEEGRENIIQFPTDRVPPVK